MVGVLQANRNKIDSAVVHAKRMQSDKVLNVLADDLEDLRFQKSSGLPKAE
jgi:hypothetical protein